MNVEGQKMKNKINDFSFTQLKQRKKMLKISQKGNEKKLSTNPGKVIR